METVVVLLKLTAISRAPLMFEDDDCSFDCLVQRIIACLFKLMIVSMV